MRQYDPTYGRFMSVDPLWAQYAPLQPYHYAGNEPVGQLDYSGQYLIAWREQDRQHLAGVMSEQFGVLVIFSENGVMQVPASELARANENLDEAGRRHLAGVVDIATHTGVIVTYSAIEGKDERTTPIDLLGVDAQGNEAGPATIGVKTGPQSGEEAFVCSGERPQQAAIIIRPELADEAEFNASGGQKTKPCGSCVEVHALIDHALWWLQQGANRSRLEGVQAHNESIQRIVGGPLRVESDHGARARTNRASP